MAHILRIARLMKNIQLLSFLRDNCAKLRQSGQSPARSWLTALSNEGTNPTQYVNRCLWRWNAVDYSQQEFNPAKMGDDSLLRFFQQVAAGTLSFSPWMMPMNPITDVLSPWNTRSTGFWGSLRSQWRSQYSGWLITVHLVALRGDIAGFAYTMYITKAHYL